MKYFYIAASYEEDGKNYAYVIKVSSNQNLISIIKQHAPKIAQICPTKKEAARIVNAWNASYKANGSYMFADLITY